MSLKRFRQAQNAAHAGFATALGELRAGRKTSHWIWYVFPQLAGLGRSPTAELYALRDLDEAGDYLRDPVLGPRLLIVTRVVAEKLSAGVSVTELMGGATDSLKLVSSLTLFQLAAGKLTQTAPDPRLSEFASLCETVLTLGAKQGFPRCAHTQNSV